MEWKQANAKWPSQKFARKSALSSGQSLLKSPGSLNRTENGPVREDLTLPSSSSVLVLWPQSAPGCKQC